MPRPRSASPRWLQKPLVLSRWGRFIGNYAPQNPFVAVLLLPGVITSLESHFTMQAAVWGAADICLGEWGAIFFFCSNSWRMLNTLMWKANIVEGLHVLRKPFKTPKISVCNIKGATRVEEFKSCCVDNCTQLDRSLPRKGVTLHSSIASESTVYLSSDEILKINKYLTKNKISKNFSQFCSANNWIKLTKQTCQWTCSRQHD